MMCREGLANRGARTPYMQTHVCAHRHRHARACVHMSYIIAVARGAGNTVVSNSFYLGKSILFIFIQMVLLSE